MMEIKEFMNSIISERTLEWIMLYDVITHDPRFILVIIEVKFFNGAIFGMKYLNI